MRSRAVENALVTSLGRKLNSLEILILVFVKFGLASTYDFISQAGMSAGLTGPPLKRMTSAGLLEAETGTRRVIRYRLTDAGERALHSSLANGKAQNWWLEENSFFESLPRSMFLTWLVLGFDEMRDWMDFLEEQLQELHARKSEEANNQAARFMRMKQRFQENPDSISKGCLLAQGYRAMKARSIAATSTPTNYQRFGGYDGLTFEMESLHIIDRAEVAKDGPE
jgi:DNA-binding PadR family transcriptional regulator